MCAQPKLQLALDNLDMLSALRDIQAVYQEIDVIEVGTILGLAEGAHALRTLRALYPRHTILSDVRIVKAGGVIANMMFEAGADWVSVVSDASLDTVEAVVHAAQTHGGEVQVELGDSWTMAQARQWRALGVEQVIFHRSHEIKAMGEESWSPGAFETIRSLAEMGLKVTVTGGISPEDVSRFRGIPVYVFISGRAIRGAPDPLAAARHFRQEIRATYS